MCNNSLTLTIIFDPPFYKAVFEDHHSEHYQIATLNLGTAEPRIQNIYNFVNHHWDNLNFSEPTIDNNIIHRKINPKRLQRIAKHQVLKSGINGTKAQQAIKLEHERTKSQKRIEQRENKELYKQKQFELKQLKKQRKHKGH